MHHQIFDIGLRHAILIAAFLGLSMSAKASDTSQPIGIIEAVKRADVAFVGRLIEFTPTEQQAPPPPARAGVMVNGIPVFVGADAGEMIVAAGTIRESGTYTFAVGGAVKGDLKGSVTLRMPRVSVYYYDTRFAIEKNSKFLIFLERDGVDKWKIVDECRPLIPISDSSFEKIGDRSKSDVVDVILQSLDEKKMRRFNFSLLSDIVDDRIVPRAVEFVDDDELTLRNEALLCLATNQDIRAIPKIIQLDDQLRKNGGGGASCVIGLSRYQKSDAIPLLNPLVTADSEFVRTNALFALEKIGNESSIPYLMSALDKEDRQKIVSYTAYAILHRLVPSLGPAHTRADFLAHRDVEIQTLKQWWEWEQLKEKKAAATLTKPASQPATSAPAPTQAAK